jgi:hypothetical protein
VCDLENLKNEEAMTRVGSQPHSKKKEKKKIRQANPQIIEAYQMSNKESRTQKLILNWKRPHGLIRTE